MKINVIYNLNTYEKVKMRCSYFLLCILIFNQDSLSSQSTDIQKGFQAEIVAGSNFSQLDGDRLSGFNKFGLRAGLRLAYPLNNKKGWVLGILYDQRGSSTGIISKGGFSQHISLDYIALPLSMYFNSWWNEPIRRHKVSVYGSLIPARLVRTESSHALFDDNTDNFKRWDVSFAIGVAYSVGRRGSIHLRIERSMLKIYRTPGTDITGLQSYLISIQYGFLLNEL